MCYISCLLEMKINPIQIHLLVVLFVRVKPSIQYALLPLTPCPRRGGGDPKTQHTICFAPRHSLLPLTPCPHRGGGDPEPSIQYALPLYSSSPSHPLPPQRWWVTLKPSIQYALPPFAPSPLAPTEVVETLKPSI